MFNSLGWQEIAVLLVVALFVFGPERLPKAAADAGRMIRTLRQMATGVRDDLQAELGPEVGDLDLASLHPKTFLQKNLFGDDDPPPRNASAISGRRRPTQSPLADDERAPYDPDAT